MAESVIYWSIIGGVDEGKGFLLEGTKIDLWSPQGPFHWYWSPSSKSSHYILKMSDTTQFPMIFGLKGKSFEWVFQHKKDWVDFCMKEMKEATGIFKVFQQHCSKKIKKEEYATSRGFQIVTKVQPK